MHVRSILTFIIISSEGKKVSGINALAKQRVSNKFVRGPKLSSVQSFYLFYSLSFPFSLSFGSPAPDHVQFLFIF